MSYPKGSAVFKHCFGVREPGFKSLLLQLLGEALDGLLKFSTSQFLTGNISVVVESVQSCEDYIK